MFTRHLTMCVDIDFDIGSKPDKPLEFVLKINRHVDVK